MTSTNDGKEVKSYQTNSPKGKSYFIELYKSLESRLCGDCSGAERTQYLCEAWRRIHSLCSHSAPSTHPHLLCWLQKHTATTLLQTQWPECQDQQALLRGAIDEFLEECATSISRRDGARPWEIQLQARAAWFKTILPNPWEHPVLKALLQKEETLSDEQILEWLKEEGGVMFASRLRHMAAVKSCVQLALCLVRAVTERVRNAQRRVPDAEQVNSHKEPIEPPQEGSFVSILSKEAGFTLEVWDFLTDIEFVLLHKESKQCIDLAKQVPFRNACHIVERLENRAEIHPKEKKIWKNAKEVALLIAQVVITRCMVLPTCRGAILVALYGCSRAIVRLMTGAQLSAACVALAAPAATAHHLHTMAAAVHKQLRGERIQFVCQLYVRAITAGMNELEKLKLNNEKSTEARATEKILSTWFKNLGTLLVKSTRLQYECVLTAFSVHPTPAMFEEVKAAPVLEPIKDIPETKSETISEFGSWATDSRTQTNFVKTSETLNLKQTQKQANVLSTAIFSEGEALGLEPELCNDLAVLLSGPRVKTLTWDMERETLLENCKTYMTRTNFGTQALTTELKYLNLDPRSFLHLPEEEDNEDDLYYGIEKGYEHLVELQETVSDSLPPEIWQDVFYESPVQSDDSETVVRRRKKKKKVPALSSHAEEDPLKLDASTENLNSEKCHANLDNEQLERIKEDFNTQGSTQDNSSIKVETKQRKKTEPKKEKKEPKAKKEPKERKKKSKIDTGQETKKVAANSYFSKLLSMKHVRKNSELRKLIQNTERMMFPTRPIEKELLPNNKSQELHSGVSVDTKEEIKKANEECQSVGTNFKQLPDTPLNQKTDNLPLQVEANKQSDVRNDINNGIKKLISFRRQKVEDNIPAREGSTVLKYGPTASLISKQPIGPKQRDVERSTGITRTEQSSLKAYEEFLKSRCFNDMIHLPVSSSKDFTVKQATDNISNDSNIYTTNDLLQNGQGLQPCHSKQYVFNSRCSQGNTKTVCKVQQSLQDNPKTTNQSTMTKITYDPTQKQFQEFLKGLQDRVNPGALTKQNAAQGSTTVKMVKSTKIADCAPNTFSRLSYLHKNKQHENKIKSDEDNKSKNPAKNVIAQLNTTLPNHVPNKSDINVNKDINVSKVTNNNNIITGQIDLLRKHPVESKNIKNEFLLKSIYEQNHYDLSKQKSTSSPKDFNIKSILTNNISKNSQLTENDQSDLLRLRQQKYRLNSLNNSSFHSNSVLKQQLKPSITDENPRNALEINASKSAIIAGLPYNQQQILSQVLNISKTTHQNISGPQRLIESKQFTNNRPNTFLNPKQAQVINTINRQEQPTKSVKNLSRPNSVSEPSKYSDVNITQPIDTTANKNSRIINHIIHDRTFNDISETRTIGTSSSEGKPIKTLKKQQRPPKPKISIESIFEDLRKLKTPSRGLNALDVTLKKGTLDKRLAQTEENNESNKIKQELQEKVKINNLNIENRPSVLYENKDFRTVGKTVEPKKFVEVQPKDVDPFISGIHNSDYDLLDELMDDDLRQEIREAYCPLDSFTPKDKSNDSVITDKASAVTPLNTALNNKTKIITCNPKSVIITNPQNTSNVITSSNKPQILSNELIVDSSILPRTAVRKQKPKINTLKNVPKSEQLKTTKKDACSDNIQSQTSKTTPLTKSSHVSDDSSLTHYLKNIQKSNIATERSASTFKVATLVSNSNAPEKIYPINNFTTISNIVNTASIGNNNVSVYNQSILTIPVLAANSLPKEKKVTQEMDFQNTSRAKLHTRCHVIPDLVSISRSEPTISQPYTTNSSNPTLKTTEVLNDFKKISATNVFPPSGVTQVSTMQSQITSAKICFSSPSPSTNIIKPEKSNANGNIASTISVPIIYQSKNVISEVLPNIVLVSTNPQTEAVTIDGLAQASDKLSDAYVSLNVPSANLITVGNSAPRPMAPTNTDLDVNSSLNTLNSSPFDESLNGSVTQSQALRADIRGIYPSNVSSNNNSLKSDKVNTNTDINLLINNEVTNNSVKNVVSEYNAISETNLLDQKTTYAKNVTPEVQEKRIVKALEKKYTKQSCTDPERFTQKDLEIQRNIVRLKLKRDSLQNRQINHHSLLAPIPLGYSSLSPLKAHNRDECKKNASIQSQTLNKSMPELRIEKTNYEEKSLKKNSVKESSIQQSQANIKRNSESELLSVPCADESKILKSNSDNTKSKNVSFNSTTKCNNPHPPQSKELTPEPSVEKKTTNHLNAPKKLISQPTVTNIITATSSETISSNSKEDKSSFSSKCHQKESGTTTQQKSVKDFKDRIRVEELPRRAHDDPLKRRVKIRLPNGIATVATISGKLDVNIDSIFSDPQIEKLLLEFKKVTLTVKQGIESEGHNSKEKTFVNKILFPNKFPHTSETINLISDDESEEMSKGILKTEFGNFTVSYSDQVVFLKHKKRLSESCCVRLEREDMNTKMLLSNNYSQTDVNSVIVSTKDKPNIDVIEIDDSSDSLDEDPRKIKPNLAPDLDVLRHSIIKGLKLSTNSVEKHSLKRENEIQETSMLNTRLSRRRRYEDITENILSCNPNNLEIKKCFVKLVRLDDVSKLPNNFEHKDKMSEKSDKDLSAVNIEKKEISHDDGDSKEKDFRNYTLEHSLLKSPIDKLEICKNVEYSPPHKINEITRIDNENVNCIYKSSEKAGLENNKPISDERIIEMASFSDEEIIIKQNLENVTLTSDVRLSDVDKEHKSDHEVLKKDSKEENNCKNEEKNTREEPSSESEGVSKDFENVLVKQSYNSEFEISNNNEHLRITNKENLEIQPMKNPQSLLDIAKHNMLKAIESFAIPMPIPQPENKSCATVDNNCPKTSKLLNIEHFDVKNTEGMALPLLREHAYTIDLNENIFEESKVTLDHQAIDSTSINDINMLDNTNTSSGLIQDAVEIEENDVTSLKLERRDSVSLLDDYALEHECEDYTTKQAMLNMTEKSSCYAEWYLTKTLISCTFLEATTIEHRSLFCGKQMDINTIPLKSTCKSEYCITKPTLSTYFRHEALCNYDKSCIVSLECPRQKNSEIETYKNILRLSTIVTNYIAKTNIMDYLSPMYNNAKSDLLTIKRRKRKHFSDSNIHNKILKRSELLRTMKDIEIETWDNPSTVGFLPISPETEKENSNGHNNYKSCEYGTFKTNIKCEGHIKGNILDSELRGVTVDKSFDKEVMKQSQEKQSKIKIQNLLEFELQTLNNIPLNSLLGAESRQDKNTITGSKETVLCVLPASKVNENVNQINTTLCTASQNISKMSNAVRAQSSLATKVLTNQVSLHSAQKPERSVESKIEDSNITVLYKDDSNNILKGSRHKDPVIGTCYLFPTKRVRISHNNLDEQSANKVSSIVKFNEKVQEIRNIDNLTVLKPTITYAKQRFPLTDNRFNQQNKKNLKRKSTSMDIKYTVEKKYRKGKNIDYPKMTVSAIKDCAYAKEFESLYQYWNSVAFSFSRPFHREDFDVNDLLQSWPIQGTVEVLKCNSYDEQVLFKDDYDECGVQNDPLQESLVEEIRTGAKETLYKPIEINENNFSMGFGEGSDRVNLKYVERNIPLENSAATLSDVKLTQPLLRYEYCKNLKTCTNCSIRLSKCNKELEVTNRFFNFIQLKNKVRSFFKKTAVELNQDWVLNNVKEMEKKSKSYLDYYNPLDIENSDMFGLSHKETIIQVVQVGQLPVSAAAQNPVSCDPRVTQVTDASPPQCSAESSPRDGSQPSMKTEYTELTTADLTIPLAQDHDGQNNQTMNAVSQDNHKLTFSDENIPIETEVNSIVKIELAEEVLDSEEQHENDDQELQNMIVHQTNLHREFCFNTNNTDSTQAAFQVLNESDSFLQAKEQNEKTDQIAHAMNAAGITTHPDTLGGNEPQSIGQSNNISHSSANNYSKATSINAIALQQALATILPPPLNRTNCSENNHQGNPQVLHIVQGKNSSVNQLTLVDNSQQAVLSSSNPTPVLHIVQNKGQTHSLPSNSTQSGSNTFNGLSLVESSNVQQGSGQLLHIVNTSSQKGNTSGQLLKRVNLVTNLSNVQGSNEQKMVQFVCKSADGKSIQLNTPHQRSMVLRIQPIESSNSMKPTETQNDMGTNSVSLNANNSSESTSNQQEIKSRSVYEENYAKFIQNSGKSPIVEKSTSLPKFNQAFGKQIFQDENQKVNEISDSSSHLTTASSANDSSECQTESSVNMEQMGQISNPPLLLRKSNIPATSQPQSSQPNLVQHLKQTITPMNLQTMHGGVIYTRQIPVNIGGGQTINLITVPSTELVDDSNQKQNANQSDVEPSIIKIVPQTSAPNQEISSEENRTQSSNEGTQNTQPQPVLTQMRIKLPMLSKPSQVVPGTRVVRPSFFQIQRNVIAGTNQPVYQQLVLTAAPPIGQQTIRLPQAQANRLIKVPSENQTSSEAQMSSSTLEQLREFDMVLEQVKERSTVQPNQVSNNTFNKILTTNTDTTDASSHSTSSTESTHQVLYTIGNNSSLNVAYVNRKPAVTTPTVSTYVTRSPDSSNVNDSPSSSTQSQIPVSVTSESQSGDLSSPQSQQKSVKITSKSKTKIKPTPHPSTSVKLNTVPPKPSTQKPFEDEQTTQRILYILAEYKEQVENSPDKDKPAPRRRSNPPSNPGSSKRKKSSSGSRRPGTRDISPVHGEDTCRTMGSEDSSCGTSQGDCTESCLDSHSPQDSPRKVVRKLTFEQESNAAQPRPQQPRNVIVADSQTITVARNNTGKPATAVLMPANYILPVSMVKSGQQIAIVTNRGPKILTVGGGEGGGNTVLLQRLIGPGLKPVLTRPGVRHVRLPAAALQNLQAFTLGSNSGQQPDSTAPATTTNPPELIDTRATTSPWADRETQDPKPEKQSSPESTEPWSLASSEPHDYSYEEIVRSDNMDRTVLDAMPDRYSPDMEAQRIFDKMFDIDSKKSYIVDSQDDSPRCGYDIDASDCDDKPYHQVVHRKDGTTQRHHRLAHVSTAALRHRYAILEHELRLQKSLSEECEDLGVDSPSASELFPEAELLFSSSPAHEAPQHSHTPQPIINQSSIPQPDLDDQIATDQLISSEVPDEEDLNMALGLDNIVTVSGDGTITLDPQEFAKSHPNTTFHREPTDESELQPFTIANVKGRHMTSTIFHASRAPATVLVTAPQTTVISQATQDTMQTLKYTETPTNSLQGSIPSVLVKDNGVSKFDSMLNRELHLSNTASTIIHSGATQVIRRVCYDEEKHDPRFLETHPLMDDSKITEDSRDATLESLDVEDDRSSPERTEMFWESNSTSERSEGRRPLDFSSDSDKCCKSPFEENSTDSSGIGTHIMRLDSVIKDARGIERSGSAESSADDAHPPLRTYPPKRYHPPEAERSTSGKTRAGESPDLESRRRASNRGVVKRGCHCCNGSPTPPKPKKSKPKKTNTEYTT